MTIRSRLSRAKEKGFASELYERWDDGKQYVYKNITYTVHKNKINIYASYKKLAEYADGIIWTNIVDLIPKLPDKVWIPYNLKIATIDLNTAEAELFDGRALGFAPWSTIRVSDVRNDHTKTKIHVFENVSKNFEKLFSKKEKMYTLASSLYHKQNGSVKKKYNTKHATNIGDLPEVLVKHLTRYL